MTCVLLLLRQAPSVQGCVEPGAKSSTDCFLLRLPICLHANCSPRAVKLFAFAIYQMALNKTSASKAIWMLAICQKSVELMATNQISKKSGVFRKATFSRERCKWRNPSETPVMTRITFCSWKTPLSFKNRLKPKATDVCFECRGSLCHPSSGVVTQMDLFQAG